MILPTKHEDLSGTSLVVGATLIQALKRKNLVIEDLYAAVRKKHNISLSSFFDVMVFLWLSGLVDINNYEVRLIHQGAGDVS